MSSTANSPASTPVAPVLPPADPPRPELAEALAFFTWPRLVKTGILAGLFFWLFHGTLIRLFLVWLDPDNSDWSHGLVIPLFSVGILFAIRDKWLKTPLRPSYGGLGVVGFALVFYVLAVWWLKAIMFQDYAWWILLVGLVATLCGWRFLGAVWFPIFFILFGIRIGGVLYDPVSSKLQQIAANCATAVLRVIGIQADLAGVTINLFKNHSLLTTLQVAEACSGMHILMALLALGALIAYMVRRPWWHRSVLVLAIVPTAIAVNVLRVVGTGLLHYMGRPDLARGRMHEAEGLLMLVVAFLLFWLLHTLLCKLVVEHDADDAEADEGESPVPPPPSPPASGPAPGLLDRIRRFRRPADFRSLLEPHFVVTAGLMLAAAAAWGVVMAVMEPVFVKAPVPLRQALDRFPRQIARPDGTRWVVAEGFGPANERLDPDTEKTLGAKHPWRLRGDKDPAPGVADDPKLLISPQYMQRYYTLVDASGNEIDPSKRVYFFISYYTGVPDTVPHVPERCYLGGGYTENVDAKLDTTVNVAGRKMPIRFAQFLAGGAIPQVSNVVYFFGFNGQFESDHKIVRLKLSNPFGKYAYYSKIEMKFPGIEDRAATLKAAEELLNDFLPVLRKDFLPDWSKYQ